VALFEIREIIQNRAILDFNAGQVSDDIIKLLFISMLYFLTTKGKNCQFLFKIGLASSHDPSY